MKGKTDIEIQNMVELNDLESKDESKPKQPDYSPDVESDGEDESDEAKRRRQLRLESREMKLTNCMVDRPCCCLSIIYFFLILLAMRSLQNNYFNLADSSERDALLPKD